MRSVSILALAAAMALSVSVPTFAQTATGVVSGTVDATTQGGASVSAGDTSVTVDAGADVSADTNTSATLDGDTDGDGTISTEEQAAIDAGADASLDADGDGTVSDEERAAGNTTATGTTAGGTSDADEDSACPAPEYTGSAEISAEDMAVLSAATTAQFIIVDDCDTGGSLTSGGDANATDLDTMISANSALSAEVAGRGIGEIFGISIEGDAVTIYAESNEGDDDSDGNAAATTSGGAATTTTTTDGGATSGTDAAVDANAGATVSQ